MKVLLVKPYNLSDHIQPSLGLGYLATAIRDIHEVEILDCIKENMKIDRFSNYVKEYNPDVVGIQCYTFDLKFIKEALTSCKEINSDIITIIGGPHPSAIPKETMDCFSQSLDFAFVGEAEKGFPLLLSEISKGSRGFDKIPGLVWRDKKSGIMINKQIFIEDLDNLGFPAWDKIRPQGYPQAQHGAFFKNFPIAPIIITRGCPYLCTFCAGKLVSGKKIRTRSPQHVLNEIKLLYDDYGIREFHIVDDNATMNRKFIKEFLEGLINLNLNISWAVPNGIRMDTLDTEILDLMKRSGLYLVSLGIESGSDRILKAMKKNITTDKIRKYAKMIRETGFDMAGFFILGFPTETKQEIEETIKFSLELDLIRANYFTYLPFPGTESYNQLLTTGELNKIDLENFYFMNAAYTPKGMTRDQLKSLQRKAFIKFFFRPKIIYKNIIGIKSFEHFKFLSKRFYHWLIMK